MVIDFSIYWETLQLRLLKSSRIPFLANIFFMVSIWFWIRFAGMVFLWLGKWFMIFLWFQYGFEYGRENDLWFFMVLNMILLWFWIWFFYGFEYDFLWFWIWFFYGFGRNLLQNPFLWWKKLLGKGNLTKIVKKS